MKLFRTLSRHNPSLSSKVTTKREFSIGVNVLENIADSSLSQDQITYRDLARDFALTELEPNAAEWDRTSHFPIDKLRKAASLGFGAMFCSDEYGGTQLSRVDGAIIIEVICVVLFRKIKITFCYVTRSFQLGAQARQPT